MGELKRIISQLKGAYNGDAWYGPPIKKILSDISAEQAAKSPGPDVHSIWEILLHMKAWNGAVYQRLIDNYVALPLEGDWPTIPEFNEAAWQQTLQQFDEGYHQMLDLIAQMDESRLKDLLGDTRNRETIRYFQPTRCLYTYTASRNLHSIFGHDGNTWNSISGLRQ